MVESEVVYVAMTAKDSAKTREKSSGECGDFFAQLAESYSRVEEVVSWTSGSEAVFAEEPESKVWGERQESMAATWCTQDTVQRGAQPFFVKNSRWRCSSVYCISGMPGYPRCCEQ
jgi:hypothetical protein